MEETEENEATAHANSVEDNHDEESSNEYVNGSDENEESQNEMRNISEWTRNRNESHTGQQG